MTPILLRTTIATLVAFGGGALGIFLGPRAVAKRINELVFAAMGALVAVTIFDVLPEAKEALSWPAFLTACVSGYALFWAISKYVYHICPACAYSELDARTAQQLQSTIVLLMIALTIHSGMDGLAVAVGDRMSGGQNLGVLLGVSFHKLPEGLALAVLLLGAGYSQRRALFWTLLIESTTELGGFLGTLSIKASLPLLGLVFAHVGGGFIYLAVSSFGAIMRPSENVPRKGLAPPQAVSGVVAFVVTAGLLSAIRRFAP